MNLPRTEIIDLGEGTTIGIYWYDSPNDDAVIELKVSLQKDGEELAGCLYRDVPKKSNHFLYKERAIETTIARFNSGITAFLAKRISTKDKLDMLWADKGRYMASSLLLKARIVPEWTDEPTSSSTMD